MPKCRSLRPNRIGPGCERCRGVVSHRHSEAPAAVPTEKDFAAGALFRRDLVRGHQFHCGARNNLLIAVPAFVQHHAAEGKVVIDGRDQAAAAGFEQRL